MHHLQIESQTIKSIHPSAIFGRLCSDLGDVHCSSIDTPCITCSLSHWPLLVIRLSVRNWLINMWGHCWVWWVKEQRGQKEMGTFTLLFHIYMRFHDMRTLNRSRSITVACKKIIISSLKEQVIAHVVPPSNDTLLCSGEVVAVWSKLKEGVKTFYIRPCFLEKKQQKKTLCTPQPASLPRIPQHNRQWLQLPSTWTHVHMSRNRRQRVSHTLPVSSDSLCPSPATTVGIRLQKGSTGCPTGYVNNLFNQG